MRFQKKKMLEIKIIINQINSNHSSSSLFFMRYLEKFSSFSSILLYFAVKAEMLFIYFVHKKNKEKH